MVKTSEASTRCLVLFVASEVTVQVSPRVKKLGEESANCVRNMKWAARARMNAMKTATQICHSQGRGRLPAFGTDFRIGGSAETFIIGVLSHVWSAFLATGPLLQLFDGFLFASCRTQSAQTRNVPLGSMDLAYT